jgi:uncharacterized protein YbgA (DUF1722 family)/uncharacterized protein YbbK (DUF523 family)
LTDSPVLQQDANQPAYQAKPVLGISSCLLGEKVRFDGGHKKNTFVCHTLTEYFDFRPFCPEVSIGLGIPRPTIHLAKAVDSDQIRCIGVKDPSIDVTEKLSDIAEQQTDWLQHIVGYIVKKDSPSCGMERVKVYKNAMPTRDGVGIYTERLIQMYPDLPVEEEGRLSDSRLRENFIQRVYVYLRWQQLMAKDWQLKDLQKFHAQHKYIYMSHNQNKARDLGALLANHNDLALTEIAHRYRTLMMQLLKTVATPNNHVNTLQHIQGYLKKQLDAGDKQELVETIEQYRLGLLPLIVPITLLRHHFRRENSPYIDDSYYLKPYPGELMLLNTI